MDAAALDFTEVRKRLAPLFARPDLRLAVLFGSVAAGRPRAASDIDIGLIADCSVEELRPEVIRLLQTDRVDIVNLARASPLLAMAVARHGRALFERQGGVFASFVSLALRRYNDTAKLRRLREQGLQKFLAERGL